MIDVIICAKDSENTLPLCLTQIGKQKCVNKVIVVSPTSDLRVSGVVADFHFAELVFEREDFCLSWARRLGVEHTESEFVAYVDADVFLGNNHLIQLREKAVELLCEYSHVSVEGILNNYTRSVLSLWNSGRYSPSVLGKGDRGFTHNTLFDREALISWNPKFTFAWEDWLLTRHIQKIGGIWTRYQQKAFSLHVEDHGQFSRTAWDVANRQFVFGRKSLSYFLLLAYKKFLSGIKSCIIKRDVRYLLRETENSIGTIVGYLNWPKYVKINRNTKQGCDY